nr:unnamed protein product [Callosobruchus chinensis]
MHPQKNTIVLMRQWCLITDAMAVNSIFTENPFDMGSSFGLALHVLDT